MALYVGLILHDESEFLIIRLHNKWNIPSIRHKHDRPFSFVANDIAKKFFGEDISMFYYKLHDVGEYVISEREHLRLLAVRYDVLPKGHESVPFRKASEKLGDELGDIIRRARSRISERIY